jgi:hypothetical protein
MKPGISVLVFSLCTALLPSAALADDSKPPARMLDHAILDFEAGVVSILKNNGRYGSDGTRFTVRDTNQRENLVVGRRLSLEASGGAHTLILTYAPLDVTTRVALRRDLQFRDVSFASGSVVDHRYLFDGYRASYLYRLRGGSLKLELGGSLQIRNANVSFTAVDGSAYAEESDIGLVPIAKARIRYRGPRGMFGVLDADALSTFGLVGDTEGGIYDVALTVGVSITDSLDLFARIRGIGGGATVPKRELENWAHFLAFTAGVRIDFAR